MRAYFLTRLARRSGTHVSPLPAPSRWGHGRFGSADGNLEPENGLSGSRGGKGAGVLGEPDRLPMGMSRSPAAGWRGVSLGCLGWALGWVLHPAALGLSQLVLLSPSCWAVIYCRASKPLGERGGRFPWEQNPALAWGIREQPCTFWGSAKPGCSKSHPLQSLCFWRGWREMGCVPGARLLAVGWGARLGGGTRSERPRAHRWEQG